MSKTLFSDNAINALLIRRRNKVLIDELENIQDEIYSTQDEYEVLYRISKESGNYNLALSMMKNVESLGYTFSEKLLLALSRLGESNLIKAERKIMYALKKICGADKVYNPMYPNFPKDVIEKTDAELFINALVHYWSYGMLLPMYEKDERFPLIDNSELTVLDIGKMQDVWEIFSNLLMSKKSISDLDKNDLETIICNKKEYRSYLPEEIPLKENVGFVSKIIIEHDIDATNVIKKYFKTATDVLRLLAALSDGDVSLSTPTKYKSMKRKTRRLIMDLLADCGNIEEDMFRYKNRWIRAGEFIHPSEFKAEKYKKVRAAFDSIRSGKKPLFFAGQVQEYLKTGKIERAARLLTERPGDFARSLDKLLRESLNPESIVNMFSDVADKISTNVIWDLSKHFMNRNNEDCFRVVIPKGRTGRARIIEKQKKDIPFHISNEIVRICKQTIFNRYKEKEPMGNVYIAPEFKKIIAPFSQRSASTANKSLERGSRIKIKDDINIIRSFIWWTNTGEYYKNKNLYNERVDLDLTVSLFDKEWNMVHYVNWQNLRNHDYEIYHSGDIIDGGDVDGEGASEFLDIDLRTLQRNNVAYAVFTVHNYTRQLYSNLKNSKFGWMEREDIASGEIFEPKTVNVNMDLSANSAVVIPVIFDIESREIIWCDLAVEMPINTGLVHHNTITENLKGVVASCYAAVNIHKAKISLFDLIGYNAKARGKIVEDRNRADIIFDNDVSKPVTIYEINGEEFYREELDTVPIITAYQTDYYMSEMM